MYQSYANKDYYEEVYGGDLIKEDVNKALKNASRHIDTLTFNRIVGSYGCLSPFQSEIIQEVTCRLAEFEYENEGVLKSVLSSYSLNGVSMSFGNSWNIKIIKGVAIPQDLFDYLSQTGLCSRSFGV